jgi:hypothetical protein
MKATQLLHDPGQSLCSGKADIMNTPGLNEQQLQKLRAQPGFIAALDLSGGSTPKAML